MRRILNSLLFSLGLVIQLWSCAALSESNLGPYDLRRATELYQEANRLVKEKDFAGAIATYQRMLKVGPDAPSVYLNVASAYAALGQCNEAAAWLAAFTNLVPNSEHHEIVDRIKGQCGTESSAPIEGLGVLALSFPMGNLWIDGDLIRSEPSTRRPVDDVIPVEWETVEFVVTASDHEIRFQRSGFLPWSKVVHVQIGTRAVDRIALEPLPVSASEKEIQLAQGKGPSEVGPGTALKTSAWIGSALLLSVGVIETIRLDGTHGAMDRDGTTDGRYATLSSRYDRQRLIAFAGLGAGLTLATLWAYWKF